MKTLVTGSSGHLGEGLLRVMKERDLDAVGLDCRPGPFTDVVGDIRDKSLVAKVLADCQAIIHTATLQKPHVETHSKQDFIDVNLSGTLTLLEQAVEKGDIEAFVYTSTTSTFGRTLTKSMWINEDSPCIPKNIYGVTKRATEDLCELFHYEHGLPVIILKTSRFFFEDDDTEKNRLEFPLPQNLKVNELVHRRLDIADAVEAHLLAVDRARELKFGRYILSSTPPFTEDDAWQVNPGKVLNERIPFEDEYDRRGWKFYSSLDRIYDNSRARNALGWEPKYTFEHAVDRLRNGDEPFSDLMREVGYKGYHGS